jgi:hypothetical protein
MMYWVISHGKVSECMGNTDDKAVRTDDLVGGKKGNLLQVLIINFPVVARVIEPLQENIKTVLTVTIYIIYNDIQLKNPPTSHLSVD